MRRVDWRRLQDGRLLCFVRSRTRRLDAILALGVAKSILIMLGFTLLVLPGIYVMVALAFAELFLVLRGSTFVDAMKESQKLAH